MAAKKPKKPKFKSTDCPYCGEAPIDYDEGGHWSCRQCGHAWADKRKENELAEEQEGGEE